MNIYKMGNLAPIYVIQCQSVASEYTEVAQK